MKIRTDFVTNSSSSNYSIEVSIIDKEGEYYSVYADPRVCDMEGSTAYFRGELGRIMIESAYTRFDKLEEKYELKEVDKENRNERIENVKVGDSVHLVRVQEVNQEHDCGYDVWDNCYIDIQNEEGSLGILPSYPAWILMDFLDDKNIEIEATVADVTPLSQRRKNAKRAYKGKGPCLEYY